MPPKKTVATDTESGKQKPEKIRIDASKLRRNRVEPDEDVSAGAAQPVSAGAIDRVVDYTFNPTREKIREMTYINRLQAILLPQLDLVAQSWLELIEVAAYRQDSNLYYKTFKRKLPIPTDPIEEFIYRFAQWSKSRDGANLKSAVMITQSEVEARAGDEGEGIGPDAWGKD